ncbi:DegQ family serine endoprotease [Roseovarius nanhaiticus]|uniref:Probable periplasmic serine endoprotease DegP-like n=1 Tax=Roseovarius nanhaiticus TaxID=573024 RepID=A0A1N7EQ34_9RHOB|nr:DegQ family serine endoprotease [Roseovarius nanhaiticus]SEK69302.1 serine protease Do [Roseovarius nanhaiticus]SIR90201.1 serine protease Do [Roseovarius nanhaiticus]
MTQLSRLNGKPRLMIGAATAIGLALTVPMAGIAQQDAPTSANSAAAPIAGAPITFSDIVKEKLPAVVGIVSTVEAPAAQRGAQPQLPPGLGDLFGAPQGPRAPQGPAQAQGSGFIITGDGYVVTNNHVIEGATGIEVVLEDERRFDAELIGTDPATDIALLKIESEEDLPHVEWGSSDDLEIGDWTVAIGNPFGLGGTVTAGILSARSRNINAGPYDDFLQTDAAINRGNSGGPLFNVDGDVVGVNTAIVSPSGGSVGIGFAVPSAVAERIVADLRDDGMVERGWLGVGIQPVTEDIAEALGLEGAEGTLVSSVTRGSPAEEAGLVPGDVILSLGGTPIDGPRALSLAVADLEVGSDATLSILRDGETKELTVAIGMHPTQSSPDASTAEPAADDTPQLGVSIAPLDAALRARLSLPEELSGLAVTGIEPGSAAAEAGLQPGDVITAASGDDIADVEALRSAVAKAAEAETPLLLRVYRGGNYTFVAAKLTQDAS